MQCYLYGDIENLLSVAVSTRITLAVSIEKGGCIAVNQILRIGQSVRTEGAGLECRVEKYLGGGGQGEVYRAVLGGRSIALKWYYPSAASFEQKQALQTLINIGAPNDRFLWPMELTVLPGVEGFGYIMPLREDHYKGIVDIMKRRIEPSFRALAVAGRDLADSFRQLHLKGLCYRDISFGNVFFNPDNGDVLICDNDNVAVNGTTTGGVLGTPRFMAPEVVRGDALPSTQTDLFSLAILLFYMLMMHHPLEGKKEADIHSFDLPAMTKLYGTDPVFIFDPDDHSNEPVPGYQENALVFWPIYPKFLRDLFIRTFTEGIRNPNNRVLEGEWRPAMVRLCDSIVYCGHCRVENFYDSDALAQSGGNAGRCWSCKQDLQLPPRIRIGRNIVMLNADTEIFPHHTDPQRPYDFSQPVAIMTQHPTNPNLWGIKNVSQEKWASTTSAGIANDIPPGKSVSLAIGTKIQFSKLEGEIRI